MTTKYKRTLFDRLGPDGPETFRSAGMGVVFSPLGAIIGGMAGSKFGATGWELLAFILAGMFCAALGVYSVMRMIPHFSGAAVHAALMPTGNSTPYETDFSYESALAMKGDVKGAIASFEEKIAAAPANAAVRLVAAEMYMANGNPMRARDLFREVQRIPDVSRRDDVLASYRLIDLFRGKLADPGRALPELRRLIDRYPDSQIEAQAREALAKLKSEMPHDA